ILPRLVAALIVVPILVTLAAVVSIFGAYLASVPMGLFSSADFNRGIREFFVPHNVTMMYVKAFVFAYLLTAVSCYQGYHVKRGSIELGAASTRAVVYSNILILVADYIIAVALTA
nr:ABC transporter permease [Saprospiraceae bacterium]